MLQSPGQLRIEFQVEMPSRGAGGDLVGREPVKAQEPVRLIEPLLRSSGGWISGSAEEASGIGEKAEE